MVNVQMHDLCNLHFNVKNHDKLRYLEITGLRRNENKAIHINNNNNNNKSTL